jgi:hypothetical protein
MTLPLKQSRALRELAEILYDFLPGSGNKNWKGHVSFKSVAEKVGVDCYWDPGSKLPMINNLLERTLEFRRDRFEPLILEIIRAGLTYRQKKEMPVTADEIENINGLLLEVDFKFPDLWDPEFIASLRADKSARASEHLEHAKSAEKVQATQKDQKAQQLEALLKIFLALHGESDRQAAGLQLERVLNALFESQGLLPRGPFRVVGEQIDGSFELDHESYLLEAKWHREPRPAADLYVFREKIEGKSKFTRGVFLSVNGVTSEAEDAITRGKQPNFFIINGHDLMMLLGNNIELGAFLRQRQRLLADDGRVCVPFNHLSL